MERLLFRPMRELPPSLWSVTQSLCDAAEIRFGDVGGLCLDALVRRLHWDSPGALRLAAHACGPLIERIRKISDEDVLDLAREIAHRQGLGLEAVEGHTLLAQLAKCCREPLARRPGLGIYRRKKRRQ